MNSIITCVRYDKLKIGMSIPRSGYIRFYFKVQIEVNRKTIDTLFFSP